MFALFCPEVIPECYIPIFPEQKRFPLSFSSITEPTGREPHENEAIE